MRRLLVSVLATFAVAASGLAVTAAPANAEGEPVISAIDVSTPGHAKGTVSTTAPYVVVYLKAGPQSSIVGYSEGPTTGGSASFDLETWGLTDAVIAAHACPGPGAECGPPVSSSFTASDIAPVVTWPEDTKVGTGEDYSVTVSDPGGGRLVVWGPSSFEETTLDRSAPTSLLLRDGELTLDVRRCNPFVAYQCRATGVTHQITVNRLLETSVSLPQSAISPALGTKLLPTITVTEALPVTLDWQLARAYDGGSTVAGFGGHITGLVPNLNGEVYPEIDLTGLADGSYLLRGTVSVETTDFGTVSGLLNGWHLFQVDSTAPTINKVTFSDDRLFPYTDGYHDVVRVSVHDYTSEDVVARLKIVSDTTGETVRLMGPSTGYSPYAFRWYGQSNSGAVVPAGTYTLTAQLTDRALNRTDVLVGKVTVVRKIRVHRKLRKTISAAASMEDKYVGQCSTLRRPSLRGWTGSIGLYSNTRCRRTFDTSLVVSAHALRTPPAIRYVDLQILAYSGAAKAQPRSLAYIEYLSRADEWTATKRLGAKLETHYGDTQPGVDFVFDDRYVVWRTYTARGARYDIKNFTVTLEYDTLIPE